MTLSIYLPCFGEEGGWLDDKGVVRDFRWLTPGTSQNNWDPPALRWSSSDAPITDITDLAGNPVFNPTLHPQLAALLSVTGTLLPLGGEAHGYVVHLLHEKMWLQDTAACKSTTPAIEGTPHNQHSDVQFWAFTAEALLPNSLVYDIGLGRLVIEENDEDDPSATAGGVRAWAKRTNATGIQFKLIWSSNRPVEFDNGWFYKALKDPSLWD